MEDYAKTVRQLAEFPHEASWFEFKENSIVATIPFSRLGDEGSDGEAAAPLVTPPVATPVVITVR